MVGITLDLTCGTSGRVTSDSRSGTFLAGMCAIFVNNGDRDRIKKFIWGALSGCVAGRVIYIEPYVTGPSKHTVEVIR